FAYIPRDLQLDILRHYRGYVQFVQQFLLAARERVTSVPAIRDFERVHYLRMLDHKLLLLAADLEWVEREIAHTDAENRQ
ncbi:MAG TPA: hypothetical protein VKB76_09815, partial [Ktedonobacterales bacterium]|nr:hypothetical protein [Ktedonobacterales bacterium]